MTQEPEPELVHLATEVRRAFERRLIDLGLLADLYARYNPAVNPADFVAEAARLYPIGNCGLATLYLRHRLGSGALVRGRYEEQPHTFLLSQGGLIVDVTADQFGGPPVYVGPTIKPWSIR